MKLNRYSNARAIANATPALVKTIQAKHPAAAAAVAKAELAKSATANDVAKIAAGLAEVRKVLAQKTVRKTAPAKVVTGDNMHKLDGFPPGGLGDILRARMEKLG